MSASALLFISQVFKALMVMSIFVLPPLLYAAIYWPSESGIDTDTKWRTVIGPSFFAYLYLSIIVSAIYMIALRLGFTPENWGFDRLAAFGIGQVAFGSLLFVPLLFIQGKNQVKTSEKKSKKKKSKYHWKRNNIQLAIHQDSQVVWCYLIKRNTAAIFVLPKQYLKHEIYISLCPFCYLLAVY